MSYSFNIVIEQGTTYSQDFAFLDRNQDPIDVSGYVGVSALKKAWTSQNSIPITVTLTTGNINLSLSANNSANVYPGFYVYTVKVTDANGSVARTQQGIATVTPSTV